MFCFIYNADLHLAVMRCRKTQHNVRNTDTRLVLQYTEPVNAIRTPRYLTVMHYNAQPHPLRNGYSPLPHRTTQLHAFTFLHGSVLIVLSRYFKHMINHVLYTTTPSLFMEKQKAHQNER